MIDGGLRSDGNAASKESPDTHPPEDSRDGTRHAGRADKTGAAGSSHDQAPTGGRSSKGVRKPARSKKFSAALALGVAQEATDVAQRLDASGQGASPVSAEPPPPGGERDEGPETAGNAPVRRTGAAMAAGPPTADAGSGDEAPTEEGPGAADPSATPDVVSDPPDTMPVGLEPDEPNAGSASVAAFLRDHEVGQDGPAADSQKPDSQKPDSPAVGEAGSVLGQEPDPETREDAAQGADDPVASFVMDEDVPAVSSSVDDDLVAERRAMGVEGQSGTHTAGPADAPVPEDPPFVPPLAPAWTASFGMRVEPPGSADMPVADGTDADEDPEMPKADARSPSEAGALDAVRPDVGSQDPDYEPNKGDQLDLAPPATGAVASSRLGRLEVRPLDPWDEAIRPEAGGIDPDDGEDEPFLFSPGQPASQPDPAAPVDLDEGTAGGAAEATVPTEHAPVPVFILEETARPGNDAGNTVETAGDGAGPAYEPLLDRPSRSLWLQKLAYIAGVARRHPVTACVPALVLGGAVAAVLHLLTPLYVATATVMIEAAPVAGSGDPADSRLAGEAAVLRSRGLAARVVAGLKLYQSTEFNPMLADAADGNVRAADPGRLPEAVFAEERALTIDRFLERLAVTTRSGAPVLDLSVTATDPRTAARIANRLAASYLDMRMEARQADADRTTDALSDRLSGLDTRLRDTEADVSALRANGPGGGDAELAALEKNLKDLQALQKQVQTELQAVAEGRDGPGARILSEAEVPTEPSFPPLVWPPLLVFAIALVAGLATAVLRDSFREEKRDAGAGEDATIDQG